MYHSLFRSSASILITAFLSCIVLFSAGQKDSVYHIGLILPLQVEDNIDKLNTIATARDLYTANRVNFDEDATIALGFYQGLVEALSTNKDSVRVALSVYDCGGLDSITALLLQKPELKRQDVIIGPVATSNAKLVADFCRDNKIVNIQPFTPSKSLANGNPYHLKLASTIDAHADYIFNSIVDSFPGANIIIYTPESENSANVAKRFDSLFRDYNKTASPAFTITMLNAKDMMLDGKKTTVAEQLRDRKVNILIVTSFEESFVNAVLHLLYNERVKKSIILYGMPNWLSGDIMRLDYLNDYLTRVSDGFLVDSSKFEAKAFALNFRADNGYEPTKYAYLGYDVMNFTTQSLKLYGRDFLDDVCSQRYPGIAYKFDISRNKGTGGSINYYENRHVNVFKVQDYRLVRVW